MDGPVVPRCGPVLGGLEHHARAGSRRTSTPLLGRNTRPRTHTLSGGRPLWEAAARRRRHTCRKKTRGVSTRGGERVHLPWRRRRRRRRAARAGTGPCGLTGRAGRDGGARGARSLNDQLKGGWRGGLALEWVGCSPGEGGVGCGWGQRDDGGGGGGGGAGGRLTGTLRKAPARGGAHASRGTCGRTQTPPRSRSQRSPPPASAQGTCV